MVCFVGVAVLGADPRIGLAIAIAIAEFSVGRLASALRGAGPRRRRQGLSRHHEISGCAPDSGLVLFRWDAPLFFANAEFFKERVLDAVAKSPTPVRWLVVAAEPVTSVDVTAGDTVAELDETLHARASSYVLPNSKIP